MLPIDPATQAIEYALDGLAFRSEITAENIANAEVPGYRASRVSFEDELSRAIATDKLDRARPAAKFAAAGAADQTGNTVAIEDELIEMVKTNLLQRAMVDAYNFKAGLLRSAMGTR